MGCYSGNEIESELNQGHSYEDDIDGDYVICVDGKNIKENEGETYRDLLAPVFLIAHKKDLDTWIEVEIAEFKNTKMVYNPVYPLRGKYGNDVVAWVEVTGPIKIKQNFGDSMFFTLKPDTGIALCEEELYEIKPQEEKQYQQLLEIY